MRYLQWEKKLEGQEVVRQDQAEKRTMNARNTEEGKKRTQEVFEPCEITKLKKR